MSKRPLTGAAWDWCAVSTVSCETTKPERFGSHIHAIYADTYSGRVARQKSSVLEVSRRAVVRFAALESPVQGLGRPRLGGVPDE